MTSWTSNCAGMHPKNDPVGNFQLNFHQWEMHFQQKQNFMWDCEKVKGFSVRKLKIFYMGCISYPAQGPFRLHSLLLILYSVLLTHSTHFSLPLSGGGENQALFHHRRQLDFHVSIIVLSVKEGVCHVLFGGFSKRYWPTFSWKAGVVSPSFLRHKGKIGKKLMELGMEALLWTVELWIWEGEDFFLVSFLNLECFKSLKQLLKK